MKHLIIPLLLVISFTNAFSQGSTSIYSEIIIPRIEFRGASYSEAIDFLRQQGKRYNPLKSGINVNSLANPPDYVLLDLSLHNVSLLDAFTAVADQVGYKIVTTSYGLLIGPPEKLPSHK